MSFNDAAEKLIYSYLTRTTVDENQKDSLLEKLKNTPMTCTECRFKGLEQIGDEKTEKWYFGRDIPIDTKVKYYICPECGQKYVKYSHKNGGGLKRIV